MRETRRFTKSEDEYLKKNLSGLGCTAVAKHLGRNPASVVSRATSLGLRKPNRTIRKFTAKEDAVIRRGAGTVSLGELAEQLGRSTSSIYGRGLKLGVFFDRKQRTAKPSLTSKGYVRIPVETNGKRQWRLEHIYVVEQRIGRRLRKAEQVHHINLRPGSNGDDNLHLCASRAAHARAHSSLSELVAGLLERGNIYFDTAEGVYKLCGTSK